MGEKPGAVVIKKEMGDGGRCLSNPESNGTARTGEGQFFLTKREKFFSGPRFSKP